MPIKLPTATLENLRRLNEFEMEDLNGVIQLFFENNPLRDCYDNLWQLITGYASSDFAASGMADYLYFYERLEALLEAVYVLHQQTSRATR